MIGGAIPGLTPNRLARDTDEPHDAELPPGWTEQQSRSNGETPAPALNPAHAHHESNCPVVSRESNVSPPCVGDTYYVNSMTGASQFEIPVTQLNTRAQSRSRPMFAGPFRAFRIEFPGLSFQTEPAVPAGWSLSRSRSTNEVYFVNDSTGHAQFEPPPAQAAAAGGAEKVELTLPDGWERHESTADGAAYYVNIWTSKSQYEFPAVRSPSGVPSSTVAIPTAER